MTADNDIQRLDREMTVAREQLREVEKRQEQTALTLERTVMLVSDIEKRMADKDEGFPAIRGLQNAKVRMGAYLIGGFAVLIFVHFLPTHEALTIDKITSAFMSAIQNMPKTP